MSENSTQGGKEKCICEKVTKETKVNIRKYLLQPKVEKNINL